MRILKVNNSDAINTYGDDFLKGQTSFERLATRAICLDGADILLVHTERYCDYSLPGGGVDAGEDLVSAMRRELVEETGALNIQNIKEFGIYYEYRTWYKDDFDLQHMISYCFTCSVDRNLGETSYEDYEIKNGMEAKWINIHEAIKFNEETIRSSSKKGLSIERETYLLKLIVNELLLE